MGDTAIATNDAEAARADRPTATAARVSKSAICAGTARFGSQAVRMGVGIVLARVLTPADFGVFAMAIVFSGFLTVVSDAGVRSAIVQFGDLDAVGLRTVFLFAFLIGCAGSVVMLGVAHYAAGFSGMPQLAGPLRALSIGMLLASVASIPIGLLQRDMRFGQLAVIEIASECIAGASAILLAVNGARSWALVGQVLASTGLSTLSYCVVARWMPRFSCDRNVMRRVVQFCGNIMAFNSVNYWARNLDSFLIGRLFGSAPLGYYSRAYSLMMYPYTMLQSVLVPVVHPAFAGMADDLPRLRMAYFRTIRVILFLSVPAAASLGVLAHPLIRALWGSQWDGCVAIFQVLCIVSLVQPIAGFSGVVYFALNRTDLYFRVGIVTTIAQCCGIVAGLRWGVSGVALGYTVGYICSAGLILYYVVFRLLQGNLTALVRAAQLPICLAIADVASLFGLNQVVGNAAQPWLHLVAGLALVAAGYATALRRCTTLREELRGLLPLVRN